MKVCVLASGSKGNCTYIESGQSKILIDCGISKKRTVEALQQIGVSPNDINGILITHEHTDHINGVRAFSRAFNTPIFAHNSIYSEVINKVGGFSLACMKDFFTNDFFFRDLTISPFEVPHDSINCMGFNIYSGGEKISLSTDLGKLSAENLESMAGSKILVLESNHDIEMLKRNPNYPMELKKRILSGHGHLSNEDSARAIYELCKLGTKQFVLAHLSEDNNTPDLAHKVAVKDLISEKLVEGKDFCVDVAFQDKITKIYD